MDDWKDCAKPTLGEDVLGRANGYYWARVWMCDPEVVMVIRGDVFAIGQEEAVPAAKCEFVSPRLTPPGPEDGK